MSQITVAAALERLQLTRLTHFTPAKNLYHIVEEGTDPQQQGPRRQRPRILHADRPRSVRPPPGQDLL